MPNADKLIKLYNDTYSAQWNKDYLESGKGDHYNAQVKAIEAVSAYYDEREKAYSAAMIGSPPVYSMKERKVLADLTDAFLTRHGCFPLDRTSDKERQWNDSMLRAYEVVGQPGTPARDVALTAPLPDTAGGKPDEGWQTVPVEPTAEMLEAAEDTSICGYSGTPVILPGSAWAAMLAAAPIHLGKGLVYTREVGDAADTYLKSVAFQGQYNLPARCRFSDLFDVMVAAAKKP